MRWKISSCPLGEDREPDDIPVRIQRLQMNKKLLN
jgi:hypothetical protein